MLADPTSISTGGTIANTGGTARSFARIRTDGYASEYSTSDGLYGFKITHTRGKRLRSEARMDFFTTFVNPLTGLTENVSATAYVVLNRPLAGFTSAQLKEILSGVMAFCGPSANQDKIIALES